MSGDNSDVKGFIIVWVC